MDLKYLRRMPFIVKLITFYKEYKLLPKFSFPPSRHCLSVCLSIFLSSLNLPAVCLVCFILLCICKFSKHYRAIINTVVVSHHFLLDFNYKNIGDFYYCFAYHYHQLHFKQYWFLLLLLFRFIILIN